MEGKQKMKNFANVNTSGGSSSSSTFIVPSNAAHTPNSTNSTPTSTMTMITPSYVNVTSNGSQFREPAKPVQSSYKRRKSLRPPTPGSPSLLINASARDPYNGGSVNVGSGGDVRSASVSASAAGDSSSPRRAAPAFVSRVAAYATADSYDLLALGQFLTDKNYKPFLQNDIITVSTKGGTADLVVFGYGVICLWNHSLDEEKQWLASTDRFRREPRPDLHLQDMEYNFGGTADDEIIEDDRLILSNQSPALRISLSFAIAQSTKLSTFEDDVATIVKRTRHLPSELAFQGKISLSKQDICRLRGLLVIEKNKVYLHSHIMDTPEFFWANQQFQNEYNQLTDYLEIKHRSKNLNLKFTIVQEMLDMLRVESQARNNTRLEYLIMILIVVMIVFAGWQLYLVISNNS